MVVATKCCVICIFTFKLGFVKHFTTIHISNDSTHSTREVNGEQKRWKAPFLKEREDRKTQKKREDRMTQKDRHPTWNVKDGSPSAKFSNTITTFLLGKRPKCRLQQSLILSFRLIDSLVKKIICKNHS